MTDDLPSTITTTPTVTKTRYEQQENSSTRKVKKASKRQVPANIERMFETFHQSAKGDFKPTFYNPFEIKHRRRTTKAQYRILENAFKENNRPSAAERKILANELGMTPRAVQVWFQNRRAKNKGGSNDGMETMGTAVELLGPEEIDGLNLEASVPFEQPESRRQRTASISHVPSQKYVQSNSASSMARRHSMPDIQHNFDSTNSSLPFKQLHDAIFGRTGKTDENEQTSASSATAASASLLLSSSQPTRLPSIAEAYPSHQRAYSDTQGNEADDVASAPPAAIMPMIKTRPRKNSVCSTTGTTDTIINPFLNPNYTTAHIHSHYPHEGQYLGQFDSTDNHAQSIESSMGFDSLMNPSLQSRASLDHAQLNASMPYLESIIMSAGQPDQQHPKQNYHKDMTAPSLSAPNSSPALLPDDHHLQLMQLQSTINELHPHSAEMVEAMANRISSTISPIEMEMLLQNAAAADNRKKIISMDNCSVNPGDFFTDLAISRYPPIDPTNPSNDMLVYMNQHEHYLGYSLSYARNRDYA